MKILSFDIEDWFHILDNPTTSNPANWTEMPSRLEGGVDRILNLLSDTGQPATFFCLGWVAEKYPNVIKKIVSSGNHIATHSHMHQLAYEQSKKQFEEDLLRSIDTLQQVSGIKIDAYRAPGFSITKNNLWVFETLHRFGIEIDCSVFAANRAHGGIPECSAACPSIIKYNDVTIKSLPINTSRTLGKDFVYSGGGYFRVLPLWYLKRKFANDNYIMTYFHPRDFDPKQPMISGLSIIRRFKSYVGIRGAYKKLEFLLNEHQFINVDMASKRVNWANVDNVVLE